MGWSNNSGSEDMTNAGGLLPPELSLHWYGQVNSTNLLALEQPGMPGGTVIAADCQDAGRGRLGRIWQSPPGMNLYYSLVLYPQLPRQHWGGFSLAAAVGLARGMTQVGVHPRIKWPNDLLLDDAKLAGILLESKNDRLVIGTGVNVNQEKFPPGLLATSMHLDTGRVWRRDILLAQFCRELYLSCMTWDKGQYDQVISAWRDYDTVLGQKVTVLRGGSEIEGMAVDVDTSGALIIIAADGVRHTLHSGEVTLKKE